MEIIRGIGYGCEEEVINAIKNCPKWKPAIFMGDAVRNAFFCYNQF